MCARARACVCVTLVIQHAKCICRITLPPVSSPALPDFSTLPHKRNDFWENTIKTNIFSTTSSQTSFILRRTERDMVVNAYRSSCKVPVILVRFESTVKSLDSVQKSSTLNFVKIFPTGVHVVANEGIDEQTYMTQLMVAFRNFANTPTNFWTLPIVRADPLAPQWGCFKGKPPLWNVYLFIIPVKYANFKVLRMWPSNVSVFIKFYSPSFATQQQTLLWNTENIFACQRFLFPEYSVLCLIPIQRSFRTSVRAPTVMTGRSGR